MIEQWYYLLALVISLCGLAYADRRFQLAFWFDARRSVISIGATMMLFVIWDLLGISFGIFYHGNSTFTLPFRLLPEFPIEELFFLFLLCYVTLVIYRGSQRL